MPDVLTSLRESLADRYQVQRELGRGGMATVYLARDLRHRRDVALKVLRPELGQLVGADRFEREIEIAARLSHPHILPLLDSGSFPVDHLGVSLPYYVMPFIEGETLRERLAREGKLPADEALRLAREVADALDYAHRRGVVHRDIKPGNILLSGGHAVVSDFGIARALGEAGADRLTATGVSPGTPQYMSPEQVEGRPDLDGRSDTYSLACVLYEMLTGVPPFAGGPVQASLARRMTGPPPGVRSSGAAVPQLVDQALQRALMPRREDRFPTAGDLATALTTSPTMEVVPLRKSPRLAVGLVAGIAVLLIAGLSLRNLLRGNSTTDQIQSLAILPLTGTDPNTQYLSDGIHETVADLLRRLPQLRVTAPSVVMQMQRQRPEATIEQLGRDLGVGAVLTWNLRPAKDSLHLRAELLRIPGASLIWSARYDRPFRDILAIQAEIARTITDSLRLQLSGEEVERITRQPTSDPVAYDLFLRGRQFQVRASPLRATMARANGDSVLHYADRVLERDSGFAGAYTLRAAYYTVAALRGWRRPFGPVVDTIWMELAQALALDSTLAEAWTQRGSVGFYLTDDWPTVKRDLAAGVRLNPDLAYGRQYYAIYLGEIEGELDSAIAHVRHAVQVEPEPLYLNTLGDLYMRARQYDSAIVALRHAIRLDPNLPGPWTRLIQCYERTRQWGQAVTARRSAPDTTRAEAFAQALARQGETGYRAVLETDIRTRIDSLHTAMSGPPNAAADSFPPLREGRIALLYAQLGEWKQAMDWVLREYERRPTRFVWFVAHPDMAGLRTDPRYLPLVRREALEHLLRR